MGRTICTLQIYNDFDEMFSQSCVYRNSPLSFPYYSLKINRTMIISHRLTFPIVFFLLLSIMLPSCTKKMDTDLAGDTTAVDTSPTAMSGPGPVTTEDRQFVMNALVSNKGEIELSTMAATKAQAPNVKGFARMLISDHTAAYNELLIIAGQKNLTPLDTAATTEHMQVKQKLQGLSGRAFDKEFISTMVKNHEKSRDAFQLQATGGSDPEIKAFAQKYLAPITNHLQQAREMDTVTVTAQK